MIAWIKPIAKAVVAFLTVIVGAIVAGQIAVEPWVEGLLVAIIAAISVYAVPNTEG